MVIFEILPISGDIDHFLTKKLIMIFLVITRDEPESGSSRSPAPAEVRQPDPESGLGPAEIVAGLSRTFF